MHFEDVTRAALIELFIRKCIFFIHSIVSYYTVAMNL